MSNSLLFIKNTISLAFCARLISGVILGWSCFFNFCNAQVHTHSGSCTHNIPIKPAAVMNSGLSHGMMSNMAKPHGYRITENKGQWHPNIRYKTKVQAGEMLFESNCFTYIFYRPDLLTKIHGEQLYATNVKFDAHVYRTYFEGANPNPTIIPLNSYNDYENFFIGQDKANWKSNVKSYKQINYQNLYSGIDLKTYTNPKTYELKYDFEVSPDANPERIALKYSGAEKLFIKEGKLHIRTSVNEMIEHIPVAYQLIDHKSVKVACEYRFKNDSTVCFYFPDGYDTRYTLTIDPVLVFSTYTGSFDDNWGMTAAYDSDGNLYSGGVILNMGNYPASVGAFQGVYGGGAVNFGNFNTLGFWCDIALIKYNSAGSNRVFATYLGGRNNELPTSLIVNKNKELWVLGITRSDNFPVSATAYDKTLNGVFNPGVIDPNGNDIGDIDIIVTKFNADGTDIIGSTYVGGSDWDGVTKRSTPLYFFYADDSRGEIILDPADNAYIITNTASANFPTTNGAIKRNLSGSQDAVLFKLNRDVSVLEWSTYFGGNGFDAGYNIEIDQNGNLYITGGTTSNNLPTTATAKQPNFAGGRADGYIFHISKDGNQIINGSYVGTTNYDQCYFSEIDDEGNVYFIGHTLGNMPTNGSVVNVPTARQFLKKMDPKLTTDIISMRFGLPNFRSSPEIAFTAFLVDMCENMYIAGWGGPNFPGSGTTAGLPITANAIQNTTDGSDFYLLVYDKNANNTLYATYFGGNRSGDHVDGGTSRFDKYGIMYHSVCASCGNGSLDDFPTTPGAWSRFNNATNCNNGSFKFNFQILDATIAEYKYDTITTAGCVPFIVNFTNQSIGAESYLWDFGDGSPKSTDENPTHTYTVPGIYPVELIAVNNNKCNKSDTTIQFVYVYAPATAVFTTELEPCSFTLKVKNTTNGGTTYTWDFGDGVRSTQYQPEPHTYTAPGTYQVKLIVNTNSFCLDSLIIPVTIQSQPVTAFTTEQDPCLPIIRFTNTTTGGVTYLWDFGDGNTSTDINPVHQYAQTGNYTVRLTSNPNSSCVDAISVDITVTENQTIVGNLKGSGTICFGSRSPLIELENERGRVLYWEISKDQGQTWVNIGKALQKSYQSGALTVETWFRVVVQNNDCAIETTEPVKVLIDTQPYGGVLTGDVQKSCGQPVTPHLTLTQARGVPVRWEQSTDLGVNWSVIPNANTQTSFSPGVITQTTYFRVLVRMSSGNCGNSYSSVAKIEIAPGSFGGNLNGSRPVCFGQRSPELILENSIGTPIRWDISKDEGRTWQSIGKAGASKYNSGSLTVTTWFRVIVQNGSCPVAISTIAKIPVLPKLVAGNIKEPLTLCGITNNTTLQLIGSNAPKLQWQQKSDNDTWQNIEQATQSTLSLVNLTQTSTYRVEAIQPGCASVFTPAVTLTVIPDIVAGNLSPNQTICFGQRSQSITLSDYAGDIVRWEISKNGRDFVSLGKANLDTYNSGGLTVDTWYRVVVGRETCPSQTSNIVKITVAQPAQRGRLSADATICAGNPAPVLTLSGTTGSIVKWQSSTDNGTTWVDIPHTLSQFLPQNVITTTQYRCLIAEPTCGQVASNSVTLTVINGASNAGTITLVSNTICKGSNTGMMELINFTGRFLYWEYSDDNGLSWQKFGGNTPIAQKDNLQNSTLFRAVTQSLACNNKMVSPEVSVSVANPPKGGTNAYINKSNPNCNGNNHYEINYTDAIGNVEFWQIKSGNNTISNINIQNTVLTLDNLTDSVEVRAVYGNGNCPVDTGAWIRVAPPKPLTLAASGTISCGTLGVIHANATGGQRPYTYILNSLPNQIRSGANVQFTNLPAGNYTVSVRDANQCLVAENIMLTVQFTPPVITNIRSVTTSSVILEWQGDIHPNIRYTVRYRILGSETWTEVKNISNTTLFISGLQNNTYYEIKVSTICTQSDGSLSVLDSPETKTFKTLPIGICAPPNPAYPGGLHIRNIEPNKALAVWSPILNLHTGQGYIVAYGLPHIAPNSWLQAVVCHPDTQLLLTDLAPNSVYRLRVRTNCTNCTTALKASDLRSAWTQIIEFKTPNLRETQEYLSQNPLPQFVIYPNPANQVVYIKNETQAESYLEVFNTLGMRIYHQKLNTGETQINSQDWASGVYVFRLQSEKGTETQKILLVR